MSDKIIKIYYAIVTSISVIVIWINFSLFLGTIIKHYLIADKEYISNNYYQLQSCERTIISTDKNIKTQKTEDEINQCKEKIKQEIINQRNYKFKENIIWNLTFTVAFLIIFLFHYLKFRKYND